APRLAAAFHVRGQRFWLVSALAAFLSVTLSANSRHQPQTHAFALTHARVIDGTGVPVRDDTTIVVGNGRIAAIGPSGSVHIATALEAVDLAGGPVIPGLVGMHDHLFYQLEPAGSGPVPIAAQRTFATLYLASGVTTIRTTGTIDFAADARIKARIDAGKEP